MKSPEEAQEMQLAEQAAIEAFDEVWPEVLSACKRAGLEPIDLGWARSLHRLGFMQGAIHGTERLKERLR